MGADDARHALGQVATDVLVGLPARPRGDRHDRERRAGPLGNVGAERDRGLRLGGAVNADDHSSRLVGARLPARRDHHDGAGGVAHRAGDGAADTGVGDATGRAGPEDEQARLRGRRDEGRSDHAVDHRQAHREVGRHRVRGVPGLLEQLVSAPGRAAHLVVRPRRRRQHLDEVERHLTSRGLPRRPSDRAVGRGTAVDADDDAGRRLRVVDHVVPPRTCRWHAPVFRHGSDRDRRHPGPGPRAGQDRPGAGARRPGPSSPPMLASGPVPAADQVRAPVRTAPAAARGEGPAYPDRGRTDVTPRRAAPRRREPARRSGHGGRPGQDVGAGVPSGGDRGRRAPDDEHPA